MTGRTRHLLTGVGGAGSVGRLVADLLLDAGECVRALVHRDDGRADALRARGAEVVVGDLTRGRDVAAALRGVSRAFFAMAISPRHLEAAAVLCAVARDQGELAALVDLSQMTVSQMTATSVAESDHQRLHWLAEHVIDWSGLPAAHVRPTVFLDNPIFTMLPLRSIAERGELALPFGAGHTSPVAADDVARVVATILRDPAPHLGRVHELTGPAVLDLDGLAEQYARALGRPVHAVDLPDADFRRAVAELGLPPHLAQHVVTVATLHRADRYDRLTHDVEAVTGCAAESVEHFLRRHRDLFTLPGKEPT